MNLSPKSGDPRWFLREQIKKQLTRLTEAEGLDEVPGVQRLDVACGTVAWVKKFMGWLD